jgi:hypothetical protein
MEIKSMKKSLVPVQPESDAKLGAQLQIDGTLVALVTQDYLPLSASSPLDISDAVKEQAKSIHDGDLSQLESMLLQQAVAMQAMFVDLAARAKTATHLSTLNTLTQLALKSATGSRQSIAVLAEIKSPRSVAFVQQANIANGPQQINNHNLSGAPPARTENFRMPENELLEPAEDDSRMDTRTPRQAGSANPRMEAVGAINRTDHRSRKGHRSPKC